MKQGTFIVGSFPVNRKIDNLPQRPLKKFAAGLVMAIEQVF
ncbi:MULTISPECIES: hypothetical protein [unclassified Bradyrhizobium]|nr:MULTISPECIES: hypothetical protein [unclassified Bradyrhizobium]